MVNRFDVLCRRYVYFILGIEAVQALCLGAYILAWCFRA